MEFDVVLNHGRFATKKPYLSYTTVYELKDAADSKVNIQISWFEKIFREILVEINGRLFYQSTQYHL